VLFPENWFWFLTTCSKRHWSASMRILVLLLESSTHLRNGSVCLEELANNHCKNTVAAARRGSNKGYVDTGRCTGIDPYWVASSAGHKRAAVMLEPLVNFFVQHSSSDESTGNPSSQSYWFLIDGRHA